MARYSVFVGASMWVLSIQYYIVQFVAALNWPTTASYSWLHNTISDLANTECGPYGSRLVCSPLHTSMNVSFVTLGITMIVGSFLLARSLAKNTGAYIGFSCMVIAGIGTILVGLFPENTISMLHVLGATLPFTLGNIGMIIIGLTVAMAKPLRYLTILSGVIGVVALVLFMNHTYLGIDIGGMERIVAYPQSIWMIIFGLYSLIVTARYNGKDEKSIFRNN